MTDFNYVTATIEQLGEIARDLGLSTEVSYEEAVAYSAEDVRAGDAYRAAPLRRLALLGRIGLHVFNQETEPPKFVADYARAQGFTEFVKAEAALTWMNLGLSSRIFTRVPSYNLTTMYSVFAGSTLYLYTEVGSSRMSRLITDLLESSVVQIKEDGPINISETTQNSDYLEDVVAYHCDMQKGVLGFLLSKAPSKVAYIQITGRTSGTADVPAFGSRSEDGSDRIAVSQWYKLAGGGLYEKILSLPLESLGVHFSKDGLHYKQEVKALGNQVSVVIPLDYKVSHTTLSILTKRQRDYMLGSGGFTNVIREQSLPALLRDQFSRNKILLPELFCLDAGYTYRGPEKYTKDPISALAIAYFQENQGFIPEKCSTTTSLRKEVFGWVGSWVLEEERSMSLSLQAGRHSEALAKAGERDLRSMLISKSLIEVGAILELEEN